MLTPIKKQGDEHIYILLQIDIINWISVCYVDILRFVWMLIGSVITYGDALSILYEVHVIGNHADGDKDLLKKSCHGITLPAAKARFAQVLRNSPRAMPLLRYPSTRGCPARHLMMPCQFRSQKNILCGTKYALRYANQPGFYVEPGFSP